MSDTISSMSSFDSCCVGIFSIIIRTYLLNSSIIKCYNNESIGDGYYLNRDLHHYETCYPTCLKCSELGDNINNKCIECKSGYTLITDNNNQNCVSDCPNYFYYDENNIYHCTNDNNCPENYSINLLELFYI